MRICKEGWPFIGGCFGAGLLLLQAARYMGSGVLGLLSGILFLGAAFCAYFFRDPIRRIPAGASLVLSPADGKILDVAEEKDPATQQTSWMIRIFLSVFDPHLQRSPMTGTVQSIRYRPGKFFDARDTRASIENEQNRIEILSPKGTIRIPYVVRVTQIAGLIARRILCWVREGDAVQAGQKIGLIRFGSQVDLALPRAAKLRVKAGDRVKAGETILGEL